MNEGTVEAITPLEFGQGGTVFWFQVKLKEREELFALHANWFSQFGKLNVGDRVRYIESEAQLGKDGTQGVNKKGWLLFNKLRKIEGKEDFEKGVTESYG